LDFYIIEMFLQHISVVVRLSYRTIFTVLVTVERDGPLKVILFHDLQCESKKSSPPKTFCGSISPGEPV